MDIGSTANKILNPIEKNATLIGVGMNFLNPNLIPALSESVTQLIGGHVHSPEWNNIIADIQNPATGQMTALMAAVAGYFLKDATSNAMITKLGHILQKAGTGYFAMRLGYATLYYSTHSPLIDTGGRAAPAGGSSGYSY